MAQEICFKDLYRTGKTKLNNVQNVISEQSDQMVLRNSFIFSSTCLREFVIIYGNEKNRRFFECVLRRIYKRGDRRTGL